MSVIWARITSWWASKNASNILLAAILLYFGWNYVAGAKCREREQVAAELRGQMDELADRVIESVTDETDERVKALREADLACLDERLPDELQDPD